MWERELVHRSPHPGIPYVQRPEGTKELEHEKGRETRLLLVVIDTNMQSKTL